MTYQKYIRIIIFILIPLAIFCFLTGVLTSTPSESVSFTSIHGETIELYGKGLYRYDSKSVAIQGIAQDIVTVCIVIPFLLFAYKVKDTIKGKLLLTGIFGYLLYTYMSYVFLWQYNPLFIAYVLLMSLSLTGFILSILSLSSSTLSDSISSKMPKRFLGIFQIVIGLLIGLMWIGRIYPTWFGKVPFGLEHYSTLVIQAMDLGFLVPLSILSGILMLKEAPVSPLLSSIVFIKGTSLAMALGAMMIGQYIANIPMSSIEVIIFSCIILILMISTWIFIINIKEKKS